MPTYPSLKSRVTPTSHLGQNCDLGEGQVVKRIRVNASTFRIAKQVVVGLGKSFR